MCQPVPLGFRALGRPRWQSQRCPSAARHRFLLASVSRVGHASRHCGHPCGSPTAMTTTGCRLFGRTSPRPMLDADCVAKSPERLTLWLVAHAPGPRLIAAPVTCSAPCHRLGPMGRKLSVDRDGRRRPGSTSSVCSIAARERRFAPPRSATLPSAMAGYRTWKLSWCCGGCVSKQTQPPASAMLERASLTHQR